MKYRCFDWEDWRFEAAVFFFKKNLSSLFLFFPDLNSPLSLSLYVWPLARVAIATTKPVPPIVGQRWFLIWRNWLGQWRCRLGHKPPQALPCAALVLSTCFFFYMFLFTWCSSYVLTSARGAYFRKGLFAQNSILQSNTLNYNLASRAVAQFVPPIIHFPQSQKFESEYKLKLLVKIKPDLRPSGRPETLWWPCWCCGDGLALWTIALVQTEYSVAGGAPIAMPRVGC